MGEDPRPASRRGVKWEPPPRPVYGRPYGWRLHIDYQRIGDALRAQPGEWAEIRVFSNVGTARKTAKRINRGLIPGLRPGIEAVSRTVDGRGVVYARLRTQ